MADMNAMVRSFDNPDEVRELTRGRFEIVRIGGITIGRATYEPDGSGPSTSGGRLC